MKYDVTKIPINKSKEIIPDAIFQAWQEFGDPKAVVVMMIHHNENNAFDQRWMEYLLWEK